LGIILVKRNSNTFKWRHFEPSLILLCVRWYCRFQLSYRDVEEMMRERGLDVDHSTIFRWVQRYAPEINKRVRQHLKMSGASYRVDETGQGCVRAIMSLRAGDSQKRPIKVIVT
jgi:transposase, IS6 family